MLFVEVITMFEIDKAKFGAFVAALRRERGYTQKELASLLFISDKAVSKWETGVSIPDTALLIPLAELLGVSVTELLRCERMPASASLEPHEVEDIVRTAISYSDERPERAYHTRTRWIVLYLLSLLVGAAGTYLNFATGQAHLEILPTNMILYAVFGAYFCCFVKTKLPSFYDGNRVGLYYDGAFRMNVPGVSFNNRNWPHIVKAMRASLCLSMALLPLFNYVMGFTGRLWLLCGSFVHLAVILCSIFLPVYLVGKKYE